MSGHAASTEGLRERLGPGARFDDPAAPAAELGWARLGTAFFARKLNDLQDDELTSRTPGQASRIVAETSYEARALAQVVEWGRAGIEEPGADPFENLAGDVELATTLPAEALRNLFRHSEVHLNVEWRDCDARAWDAVVRLPGRRTVRVRDTARLRAVAIWRRAVDLGRTSSLRELPPALVDAMLGEAAASWQGRQSFLLRPSDRDTAVAVGSGSGSAQEITGSAADLAAWFATGRPAARLRSSHPIPELAVRPSPPST